MIVLPQLHAKPFNRRAVEVRCGVPVRPAQRATPERWARVWEAVCVRACVRHSAVRPYRDR
jgi:hypothetical protein